MQLDTENQLKESLISSKRDELHFLDQIHKYMKHLEFMYTSGKLEDKKKAFHIEISLSNIDYQREILKKEMENLENETVA